MFAAERRGYEFGNFRLYPAEALLLRDGHPVSLHPKTFRLLCVLVENRGHLVGKEALMREVWPDTFVVDSNLTYNISMLRKALDDPGNGNQFIATSPKHGYRFLADVREIVEPVVSPLMPGAHTEAAAPPIHPSLEQPAVLAPSQGASWSRFSRRRSIVLAGAAFALIAGMVFIGNVIIQRARDVASARAFETSGHAMMSSNAEANDAFQRGVHVLDRRSPVSGKKGVEFLEQAVAKDPRFALAYAHLAVAYVMNGDDQPAIQAAAKAIALNPQLSEAHAAAGFIAMFRNWDWASAERELRQAVSLDPDYPRGHQWLGNLLQLRGNFAEAEKEMRRALALDPHSALLHTDLCDLLYYARRYEEAITECKKAVDIDPDFAPPHGGLQNVYFAQRDYDAAAHEGLIGASKADDTRLVAELQTAYRKSGITGFLQAEVKEQLGELPPGGYYAGRDLARLGDIDGALAALLGGYKSRDFFMVFIKIDPALDPLRSDPRYAELVRRIGL